MISTYRRIFVRLLFPVFVLKVYFGSIHKVHEIRLYIDEFYYLDGLLFNKSL